MNAPILILSFNRPTLLRAVLRSLVEQQPPLNGRHVAMFQDGARSRFAEEDVTNRALIEECVSVFREFFPNGVLFESDANLGSPLNYERAEVYAFEMLDANAGIFLEDDLQLGAGYIAVVDRMLNQALADGRIGYVAAFGHLQANLAQQVATPRLLRPLHLLWGFGLTKSHWIKMRPFVSEYLDIVRNTTYNMRDHVAIRAMTTKWGIAPGDTSQDRIKSFATALVGATKLNTEVSYARNIGAEGLTFSSKQFIDWGLDKSEISNEIITLDLDFDKVVYDPWYDQNNIWKLGESPFEKKYAGLKAPTREEVIWLYRCVLGREVEGEEVIKLQMTLPCFDAVREALFASSEFCPPLLSSTARKQAMTASAQEDFVMPSANMTGNHMRYIPTYPNTRLAVVSIVKNEQERVAQMILSATALAELFVIVDTGSTDNTRYICTALGSSINLIMDDIEFVNFSQARNHALSIVPDEIKWILMLDADEHIVAEDYTGILKLIADTEADGWNLPRYNFIDAEKLKPVYAYPDYQKRLFRNNKSNPVRYTNSVHETISGDYRWKSAPEAGPASQGGPHIHHIGWVGVTRERWLEKHKLYERLGAV